MFVTAMIGAGPTRTFATQTGQTGGSSTYTFSSTAIGTAAASRYVVVCAEGSTSLTATTLNSVAIDGNAATAIASVKATESPNIANIMTAIYGLAVPSGTTASIVVTFSAVLSRGCTIAVYALYDLQSTTPFSTNTNTAASGTSISTTINIPGGGIGIATIGSYSASGGTMTAGLSQDYSAPFVPASLSEHVGGSNEGMNAETARTITMSGNNSLVARSIAAASWS